MNIKLQIIILLLIGQRLISQDTLKQNISNLWWNGNIEVFNKRMSKVNHDDAIVLIRNQSVTTNCYSNFYRYKQNIQQPSGEQVNYHPLTDYYLVVKDKEFFRVLEIKGPFSGEIHKEKKVKFSYRILDVKEEIDPKSNFEILKNFVNRKLKISKVLFKDSLEQFKDSCHDEYFLELLENGEFKQGYEDEVKCKCDISAKQFQTIKHYGFAKFSEANHSLLGKNGDWKVIDSNLYLKFQSGNIFTYNFVLKHGKLFLKNYSTTLVLE